MSRKILWCGGSHLATAHQEIGEASSQNNFDSDFFITAGGPAALWSIQGGEWEVFDNHFVRGYTDKRLSHSLNGVVNVRLYDVIVFIGQYIQPSRVFQPCFDWTMASEAVLRAVIRASFHKSPHPNFTRTVNNNIVDIFKEIKKDACQMILFADPFVDIKARTENNQYYVNNITQEIKEFYYKELFSWAEEKSILPVFQDKTTYDKARMATYTKFVLHPEKDDWHMNSEFWGIAIQKTIVPLIERFIR